MSKFALIQISTQEVLKVVDGQKRFRSGLPPVLKVEKDAKWLKYVEDNPPVDQTQVKSGPVDVITNTKVTRTWTVRSKTLQEISDAKSIRALAMFDANPEFKALIMSLDKGTIVPGGNVGQEKLIHALEDEL